MPLSHADLLAVDDARARILGAFTRLEAETVTLADALHRVLAEDIVAPIDLPPFGNSSMDGFALRSADTSQAAPNSPVLSKMIGHIAAGSHLGREVAPGTCARIMTGAPVPEGADAVIPFEEVQDREDAIMVFAPVKRNACIRPRGNDVRAGTTVLQQGLVLHPAQIGLIAALGIDRVAVTRRPLVGVLSTGDELRPPGVPLQPGQIYNSNSLTIAAAVAEAGGLPRVMETAADDPVAIRNSMKAARACDLLVTSGGASVGDFDYIKDIIGEEGDLSFWKVRIRPGKPLVFGSLGDLRVIGLPGNPTSAMVTFEEFVRPAIRTMTGGPLMRREIEAVVDDHVDNSGGRQTYSRVLLEIKEGRFHATLSGSQDSAMLLPLASAQGLLIVPEDVAELRRGDLATVQLWD